jgi:hypothetical protein
VVGVGWLRWFRGLGINEAFWNQREWDGEDNTFSPSPRASRSRNSKSLIYHVRLTVRNTKQFEAAKYYRLAEKNGNKIIGNTWYVENFLTVVSALPDNRRLVFPLDNRRCPLLP